MVQIVGKYSFVSQENFENYLKAAGMHSKLNCSLLSSNRVTKVKNIALPTMQLFFKRSFKEYVTLFLILDPLPKCVIC